MANENRTINLLNRDLVYTYGIKPLLSTFLFESQFSYFSEGDDIPEVNITRDEQTQAINVVVGDDTNSVSKSKTGSKRSSVKRFRDQSPEKRHGHGRGKKRRRPKKPVKHSHLIRFNILLAL